MAGIAMQPRILIAAKDDRERQNHAGYFSNARYAISTSSTGQETFDVALQQQPEIILLDVGFGDKRTIDILRAIVQPFCSGSPYLPSILMTGNDPDLKAMLPHRKRTENRGGEKIEQIVAAPLSLDHILPYIINLASNGAGRYSNVLYQWEHEVQKTLALPRWAIYRNVKELMGELDDSPADDKYKGQLEKFLHRFAALSITFRTLQQKGLMQDSFTAVYPYRMLAIRDMPELRWHSKDTAQYAIKIGKMMGLGNEDINHLRFAGVYHDIGQLPASDFYSMKEIFAEEDKRRKFLPLHPYVGTVLLKELGVNDDDILSLVESHHTNYDGTGYPANDGANDTPLHGIIRVAEMVDSMKRKMQTVGDEPAVLLESTINQVTRELEQHKGSLLNPRIVDAALPYIRVGAPLNDPVWSTP